MNYQSIKSKLLVWLESLEDEALLLRIHDLIEQAKSDDFEANFPKLTLAEMQDRLSAALEDSENGRLISHDDVMNEDENW